MTAWIARLIAMAAGATIVATACLAGEPDMGLRTPLPPQAPMTEGLADLGKVKLWYWDTGGAGEVIVFLHPGQLPRSLTGVPGEVDGPVQLVRDPIEFAGGAVLLIESLFRLALLQRFGGSPGQRLLAARRRIQIAAIEQFNGAQIAIAR